jgi:hypothetical protein
MEQARLSVWNNKWD